MQKAAQTLTPGCEAIYYNAYNNFTLQYMLALAPLTVRDDDQTAREKIRLVTTFADIFLARRMVNFRRNGYATLQYTVFNLLKDIRDNDIGELRATLNKYLENMTDTFAGVTGDGEYQEQYSLNNFSGRSIRYLLARMTAWIEQRSGEPTNFDTYARPQGEPFEIEHIWAYHYAGHGDDFPNEADFQYYRNFFGGLVLLPSSINKSLSDKPYEYKLEKYGQQNLLASSLNKQRYANEPKFKNFRDSSGLLFKPHEQFKKADLLERQELYRQICEQIWNPNRLNAI